MKRLITTILLIAVAAGSFLMLGGNRKMTLAAGPSPIGLDMSEFLLKEAKDANAVMEEIESLQASSIKLNLPWQAVESAAGLFAWSINPQGTPIDLVDLFNRIAAQGIDITLVLEGFPAYLQYENLNEQTVVTTYLDCWERYVKAVVAQFGEVVHSWQIGESINLPLNIQASPIASAILANPATFAQRLEIASAAIKEADQNDLVILGGIVSDTGNCLNQPSAFLHSLNSLDAWDAFDVIGIDLTTYSIPPEGKYMYQTYDTITGACITSAEGGFSLVEIIALVDAVSSQYGSKPIWITNLHWDSMDVSGMAEQRGTLLDLVRADLLSRASLMLLGGHNVQQIYWQHSGGAAEQSDQFGVFSRQVFMNLSQSLRGFRRAADQSDLFAGVYQYRMTTSGKVNVYLWRSTGGDQFQPYTMSNIDGYTLQAFSLDAQGITKEYGVDLSVNENGETTFMLSERPVLVQAIPTNLKERISLYLEGLFSSAGSSLKKSADSIIDTQKEKASQKVEEWVDEQKDSLFEMIKNSFMEWLKEAINLEQLPF